MAGKAVLVEVSGGVVDHVEIPLEPNGEWEVIDYDNMEAESVVDWWDNLSDEAKEFIKTHREETYEEIMENLDEESEDGE
jgi:hypothetical protein